MRTLFQPSQKAPLLFFCRVHQKPACARGKTQRRFSCMFSRLFDKVNFARQVIRVHWYRVTNIPREECRQVTPVDATRVNRLILRIDMVDISQGGCTKVARACCCVAWRLPSPPLPSLLRPGLAQPRQNGDIPHQLFNTCSFFSQQLQISQKLSCFTFFFEGGGRGDSCEFGVRAFSVQHIFFRYFSQTVVVRVVVVRVRVRL